VSNTPRYDVLGVGLGPFNLSAAALCAPIAELKTLFVDRKPEFSWHPGLMLSGSTIQTSHLKDLVTLADPTSKYGFLSYLHYHGRMYRFITADLEGVERAEFNDYFSWVSKRLDNVRFGVDVDTVDHDGNSFILNGDPAHTAKNLMLATGLSPTVPDCILPHVGERVFHAHLLLHRKVDWRGKRVVIIGGGQSGAEVFNYLLGDSQEFLNEVCWVSSRQNFLPLDDSPFTNELFTPGYANYFFDLPADKRMFTLQSQKLASDGISAGLLREIYRKLYALEFLRPRKSVISLRPNHRLVGLEVQGDGYQLVMENCLTGDTSAVSADIVIAATGYTYKMPRFLAQLKSRIHTSADGGYVHNRDFSIQWDGPPGHKIYLQNAAINSRGIADPNLSLMAWRSANIVNDIVGRPYYKVDDSKELKLWV
jgi:lysine N6-hydroxylase